MYYWLLAVQKISCERREYVLPGYAALYEKDKPSLSIMIQDHFIACGIRTTKVGTGYKVETGSDGKAKKVYTDKRDGRSQCSQLASNPSWKDTQYGPRPGYKNQAQRSGQAPERQDLEKHQEGIE